MTKLYSFIRNAIMVSLAFLLLNTQSFANEKMNGKIKAFVPSDYEVLEFASGDLNGDKYPDYVLILRSKNEVQNPNLSRPLILLKGTAKGNLELMARNDRVVLCSNCGGIFGDASPKVSIKDKSLSIENTGGSNWRYTRVITFKYDPELKDLILHNDAGISYHISAPNRQKNVVSNQEDFDKLPFADFSYNKGFN